MLSEWTRKLREAVQKITAALQQANFFQNLRGSATSLIQGIRQKLPADLNPLFIFIPAGLFIVALVVLIIGVLVSGPSKSKSAARNKAPQEKPFAELKGYYLFLEPNVADQNMKAMIIQPEEFPIRQDKNYLEENLRKSKLFDQTEIQVQMELNKLAR